MSFRSKLVMFAALAGSLASTSVLHAAPNALPPLPQEGAPPAGGSTASQAGPGYGDAAPVSDEPKKGIVLIEGQGRVLAIGTILKGDGRVLTSFSALAGLEQVDVRYTDNTVVHARLGHKDKAWDLALLIPLAGKWVDGFLASEADPATIDLRVLSIARGKAPTTPSIHFKARTDARGKDGDPVPSALDLDFRGAQFPAGSPVLDPSGNVVALLVHACKANAPAAATGAPAAAPAAPACVQTTIGAPVFALRNFLVHTPLNAVAPAPWLGIGGASAQSGTTRGVRVIGVAPHSPAETAGLKAKDDPAQSDIIVAVDGQPVDSPDALSTQIGKHAVGQTIKLLVFGSDNKFRELSVTLRAAP